MGRLFKILFLIITIALILTAVVYLTFFLNKSNSKAYQDYPLWDNIRPLDTPKTFQLMPNWFHEAEFSGFYAAKLHGFYKIHNLDVQILPFSMDYSVMDSVRAGVIDFGLATPADLVSEGSQQYDLVVIAAIYQVFPGVFLVMENSGITSPRDFCGKTVISKNPAWMEHTRRTLQNVDIDPSCIRWDNGSVDIQRFLRGEVDIWNGYIQDEPNEVELAGYSVRVIYLYDYGFEDYAELIVTRRELIENDPEAVKCFLAVSLLGWDYALRNTEESLDCIMQYAPDLAINFQRQALKKITPFVKCGSSPIGWIERDRWDRVFKCYGVEHPDSLLFDDFLHEIYGSLVFEDV